MDLRAGGDTRYTARVPHWSVANCAQHVKMGFREGWGRFADQFEAAAKL